MRTTEFVQLWKKLYILVETPLSMKLRAKDSVLKMYSFLMVVQLFKNIHRGPQNLYSFGKNIFFISATFHWYKILCTEKTCTFIYK